MSAAVRLLRRMLFPRITLAAFALYILTPQGSTANDAPFTLVNKATGQCILKKNNRCLEVRWTTGNRLFAVSTKKCVGAQGKSVGSEVSLYDCDDKSGLQMWECRNHTMLALKDKELYIEVRDDQSVALSRSTGPNNQLTITGTASGPCTRTHRELYTIGGNAFGRVCVFPFLYKDRWFGECTTYDSSVKRLWCAVESKFERQEWGYCPSTSREHWAKSLVTGAYYQVNLQSALTWAQAEFSCKQQGATLISVTDHHEQEFISTFMGTDKYKLWIGLVLDPEHGWMWSDGKPFRFVRWSNGNPLPNPGHNCAFIDTAGLFNWQSSTCGKRLGYVCYTGGALPAPTQNEQGFCSSPWIPYNGRCYHLHRPTKKWTDAQIECRKEQGDLVSIHHVEDQGFVISQLGFASTDELWIGLNDRRTEGLFDWSDHATVSFTSWEYGKPTVSTDMSDCVLIRGENGNWADRSCDEKHGFICMKQSDTESTGPEVELDIGCRAGWKRHGSYCYFTGTETKTFDEAKADCKGLDSYLADVSNGVDNAFLVSLVGLRAEKYFWLGLSNQKNFDQFVWTNSDFMKFAHWNANMPGNLQGCVAMTTGVFAGLWDLLPCTNREKYICKHLAEGAVVTVPPPTQNPAKCEEGWVRVGTRNVCAKFFTGPRSEEKTWFEARDYCRAIGGDLLSIHGLAEQLVGRYGRAWIGLSSPDSSSGYVWSDGSPVNFKHWKEGEPNNFNNEESCVEFRIYSRDDTGSWNDVNCDSYNDWLCQIRAGVSPKTPPNVTATEYNVTSDGWLVWKDKQYFVNRKSLPMEEARLFCQKNHGDLVSITSKEENIFLWKQISRSFEYYYIGLQVDLDGSFWWMDGTTVGLQRWDENQPSMEAFNEGCVTMTYYMGFWRTSNCGKEFMSICKRGHSPPANTTVAPTAPPQGGCPLQWTKFGSKCYSLNVGRRTTWDEARKQCITIGGNLVSIGSRRVQAFLNIKMVEASAPDLWIGLSCKSQEEFFWVDGKPRRYTNWGFFKHFRRPLTFYQIYLEEDCVVMNSNPGIRVGTWLSKPCNETKGFICHRNLDPDIRSQPETAVPNIYVSVGNDSIKAVTQNLTWDNAKKHCEGDKATLANLRNEGSKAYVELLTMNLKGPLWIGLNKQQTDGYFRYIDGWHLNIAYWAPEEPSVDKPCVYMDVDGFWRTDYCNRTMNSVCMQSTDVAPTQSSSFPGICPEESSDVYRQGSAWLPFRGYCYLFILEATDWSNAASSCARHGGILASVEDPAEQKFLEMNLEVFKDSQGSFWLGLYKTHKGTWLWLDKTVMDFTNWDSQGNSEYGCISTKNGLWLSSHRWNDRPYICKTLKVIAPDAETRPEPHGGPDTRSRVHTSLVVVLVIAAVSGLIAAAIFLYKKAPRAMPAFHNPLYFDSERSQPDVVDTNKLIENAEEETPEPIIAL